MNGATTRIALGIVLGILLIIIGLVYATHAAQDLPSYFPGSLAGSTTVHYKHAIAAFLLGIASFVYAWFQGGGKSKATNTKTQ